MGKQRIVGGRCAGPLDFVTDRALLGIKPVWRNGEHIVALDADAVDYGTYDCGGLG